MQDHPMDPRRRRLLKQLGLAGALYTVPALSVFGTARASSSGASGASGASRRSSSGPSRLSRPVRVQRERRRRPAPPPPELVLLLPAGVPVAAAEAAGYRVIASAPQLLPAGTRYRLGLPAGRGVAEARGELALLLPGGIADANGLYRPDEFLCPSGCDAHEAIGWSGAISDAAPRIGMIDTGVNTGHDAFLGARLTVHQADLGGRAAAGRQHGTAIAAMLVGRADGRVPGLLPNAELIAVEAFHSDAAGDAADAFALAGAVDTLIAAGVSVINLSFSGPANAVLEEVTRLAAGADVGLVAAAGNGGAGAGPAYPAAWPHVVAVTAVDRRMQPYRQANRGPYIRLAAPGVRLWTAASISGGRLRSGTSYAAPFVTAVLAAERARAPELGVDQAVARLAACARDLGAPGHDPVFGHGLVSAPGSCAGAGDELFPASGE